MIFKTRTATIAKIHFVPVDLIYSGEVDMIEFTLTNYTITAGVDGKHVKQKQEHYTKISFVSTLKLSLFFAIVNDNKQI
jgi:hypothetical protein